MLHDEDADVGQLRLVLGRVFEHDRDFARDYPAVEDLGQGDDRAKDGRARALVYFRRAPGRLRAQIHDCDV